MSAREPDPIFASPLLAPLYDVFDDDRSDLDAYVAMVDEFAARSVLDVGCGTGSLLVRLAAERPDLELIGCDPAAASLAVARTKPGADRVTWIEGGAADIAVRPGSPRPGSVDFAAMTGNVAQVFASDEEWAASLDAIAQRVRVGGVFAFETRDPGRRAWERWTPERSRRRRAVPGHGEVEVTTQVVDVSLPLLTFDHVYRFVERGEEHRSRSTLRFRSLPELHDSLDAAGFAVDEVRDAPDRPGLEWVFICRRRP